MMTAYFIYDEQQTFMCSRGETIMTDKPREKKKTYRLDEELAYELELHAVKQRTSEVELVRRYIREGLRRDKGQTNLDDEI